MSDYRNELLGTRVAMTAIYQTYIERGWQQIRPAGQPDQAARILVDREMARLAAARLYFADRDLVRDIQVTAESGAKTAVLRKEDLPVDFGLVWFDEPVGVNTLIPDTDAVHMRAAVWGIWADAPKDAFPDGGVWVTWYTDRDLAAPGLDLFGQPMTPAQIALLPKLTLETEMQFRLTDAPSPTDTVDGPDSGYARSARALIEFWRLLRDGEVHLENQQLGRAARRRSSAAGVNDQLSVTVASMPA